MKTSTNAINELEALRNALKSFNLKGYEIYQDANQKKVTYCFVRIDKENLTGWWDYTRINHFIMGYGKAFNARPIEDAKGNTISIVWGIDDVMEQAKQDEKEITEDQARKVLKMMKDNHDCNYGITWETISAYIDQI